MLDQWVFFNMRVRSFQRMIDFSKYNLYVRELMSLQHSYQLSPSQKINVLPINNIDRACKGLTCWLPGIIFYSYETRNGESKMTNRFYYGVRLSIGIFLAAVSLLFPCCSSYSFYRPSRDRFDPLPRTSASPALPPERAARLRSLWWSANRTCKATDTWTGRTTQPENSSTGRSSGW